MRSLIQQCYCFGGKHPLDDEKFYELIVKSCNKKLDIQDFKDALKDKKDDSEIDDIYHRYEDLFGFYVYPQIRNPTKVSERCGPNRQECDFSSLD